MKEEGFDFIATGEVLGERPMSQHKQALGIVERESGLEGYLLRPLSAKVLEPTIPEKEGLVDREKLEGISGRTRRRQLELAEQFDIKEYPSPGGGCALTESGFVERLKVLMKNKPDFTPADVDLVRFGRHFWLNGIQIILGRDAQENELLKSLGQGNILLEMENFPGPVALVRDAKQDDPVIEEAKKLLVKFSKAKDKDFSEVKFRFL